MADDKKTISPDVGTPTEVSEQPNPAPDLADATAPAPLGPEALAVEEQLILEHEGQAALFEMGDAVPDPADAVTHAEVEEAAAPEVPKAEKEQAQPPTPGKDDPAPAHSGKVVDFAVARDKAAKEEKKAVKQSWAGKTDPMRLAIAEILPVSVDFVRQDPAGGNAPLALGTALPFPADFPPHCRRQKNSTPAASIRQRH